MWSIVAREVTFGIVVAFMISVEQRAIETVVSADISHNYINFENDKFWSRLQNSGAVATWTKS